MAYEDGRSHWEDDDTICSSHSDESPILLSYRNDRQRHYAPYIQQISSEEKDRRCTFTILAKFFLFSMAMILFCVLMYIPVYNKANHQLPKVFVSGWSVHTNRDTKIYVQPNNVTIIREPSDVCPNTNKINKKNQLFLLIVVCSSTENFKRRLAIRETWGNYKKYMATLKIFNEIREKYKNYNYTYDLYPTLTTRSLHNLTLNSSRIKREISGFKRLLPELAKAIQENMNADDNMLVEEKRFDDEEESVLPEFDMSRELEENYDYNEYESNIMRIPPKGSENSPDLMNILSKLKKVKNAFKKDKEGNIDDVVRDFKLVFILGLPAKENDTEMQGSIEAESNKYKDIIQEGFLDTYNNLTLKSIMMLKWITNNCKESVRYVLKTDDDMYINVPNLMVNLKNRSEHHDSLVAKGHRDKEYLLIGDLFCGARPVQDTTSKWYSPRYMYGAKVYPKYLSGTGYVLSTPAAKALYNAALTTHFFHLEDIYITGICAARSRPRVTPRDDPTFSYHAWGGNACVAHDQATAHRVSPTQMHLLARLLADPVANDRCERKRLTQVHEKKGETYVTYRHTRLHITNKC